MRSCRFFGLDGSGWWLGKLPSTSQKKFGYFVAQAFVEFARECAADTVARVDGDFHRAFELDVADDIVVVFAGDVFFGYAALFVGGNKTVFFNNG